MNTQEETTQLPLEVSVSATNVFVHRFRKAIREFKYSPLIQVLLNYLFWVNAGIVGGMYLFLQQKSTILHLGLGVVFLPGSKSQIPFFLNASVRELNVLPYLWYAMITIWIVFALVSINTHSSGRYGMTSYLLGVSLLLLLLISKVILVPLLIIGG